MTYPDNSFKAVTGDLMLKISCIATGSPKPTIMWEKDGLNIAFGNIYLIHCICNHIKCELIIHYCFIGHKQCYDFNKAITL